jgi:hypothetical protein
LSSLSYIVEKLPSILYDLCEFVLLCRYRQCGYCDREPTVGGAEQYRSELLVTCLSVLSEVGMATPTGRESGSPSLTEGLSHGSFFITLGAFNPEVLGLE